MSYSRKSSQNNIIKPIQWKGDHILLLDQTRLPGEETYLTCRDAAAVAKAIKRLAVRGAPALGVAAALAVALETRRFKSRGFEDFHKRLQKVSSQIIATRPTAVNIRWAVERILNLAIANRNDDVSVLKNKIEELALDIYRQDIEINQLMGVHGQKLIPGGATIITHCNTGSLATAGFGTALGLIRAAVAAGKKIFVVSCETRPLLQGCRLTAWELKKSKIPFELITDSTAGYYMKKKGAHLVIIGADRIAANGDTANKIGSYSLAVLAKEHGIPYYVAAPVSTIDVRLNKGDDIPIEERSAEEVTHIGLQRLAPQGTHVWNPAFDVVPAKYISGIITEKGVIHPPYRKNIKRVLKENRAQGARHRQ
jgi:methylthioribose-1-phosphate isomerase